MSEAEDLTARARIRDAALEQFAEHGFERATIRGIAQAAGVSPGLLRHHFGSKEDLRAAVDAYVEAEILKVNDEIMKAGQTASFSAAINSRETVDRFRPYLTRALSEGSSSLDTFFAVIVNATQEHFELADAERPDPPFIDARTRATLYAAMVIGAQLLGHQISRVLGVDIRSPEGDRLMSLAALDIYSHPIVTPELASQYRDALEATTRH
jgi:AcrR family transcriptional regulator